MQSKISNFLRASREVNQSEINEESMKISTGHHCQCKRKVLHQGQPFPPLPPPVPSEVGLREGGGWLTFSCILWYFSLFFCISFFENKFVSRLRRGDFRYTQRYFSKRFIQALYPSTSSKHFIKALYQSTLSKHFIQALDTSTLSKHFIKVLQLRLSRYYNRVYQGISNAF